MTEQPRIVSVDLTHLVQSALSRERDPSRPDAPPPPPILRPRPGPGSGADTPAVE